MSQDRSMHYPQRLSAKAHLALRTYLAYYAWCSIHNTRRASRAVNEDDELSNRLLLV